jgi:hypothetical protein
MLVEQETPGRAVLAGRAPVPPGIDPECAARRSLRAQIARLERDLAQAFVTAAPMGGLGPVEAPARAQARLLGLGELERVRDELAGRLSAARERISRSAEDQEAARVRLERMLLEPGRHKFMRVSAAELGEPSCAVWQSRPRLGLIGMLAGWWQVKLSSGCPLSGAHEHLEPRYLAPGPTRSR